MGDSAIGKEASLATGITGVPLGAGDSLGEGKDAVKVAEAPWDNEIAGVA